MPRGSYYYRLHSVCQEIKLIGHKNITPDFLIPIKAALFPSETDKSAGRKLSSLDRDASISIFPRALLHPAFVAADESRGKKDSRGYVVCKKSAVHDFANKGALTSICMDECLRPKRAHLLNLVSAVHRRMEET